MGNRLPRAVGILSPDGARPDSYDAALDKVKAMQAKADPVKQKNRQKIL